MDDVFKIVVGAMISLVTSVVVQRILFKVNEDYKNKKLCNNLGQLSKETFRGGVSQLRQFRNHTVKLISEPDVFPYLHIEGYKPWDVLAIEVLKDSSLTAFHSILSNHLDTEKHYYRLRRYSNSLATSIKMNLELNKDAHQHYIDASKSIKELVDKDYLKASNEIFKTQDPEYEESFEKIRKILTDARNSSTPLTIPDLYNKVLLPIDAILYEQRIIPQDSILFVQINRQLVLMYKDLVRHNQLYKQLVSDSLKTMVTCLKEIRKVKRFLAVNLS